MEVSVKKPGSPAELVEHSGQKGMKWGVRKERREGSRQFKRENPTAALRGMEIRRARVAVRKQESDIARAKTPAERKKLTEAFLKNPDRATALRLTRGEKIVGLIIAGPATATLLPGAVLGGIAGYRFLKRRSIEEQQIRAKR